MGQVPTSAITVTVTGGNAYYVAFTTPHPLGDNYLAVITPRTTSFNNPFVVCTCTQTTSQINVWCRTAANALITNSFYVYTVP